MTIIVVEPIKIPMTTHSAATNTNTPYLGILLFHVIFICVYPMEIGCSLEYEKILQSRALLRYFFKGEKI